MHTVLGFSGISLTWLAAATLLLVVVATADPTCSCVCSLTADGPCPPSVDTALLHEDKRKLHFKPTTNSVHLG